MRIALLCSGLGNVLRGHETFARDLFGLLRGHLDITLFQGGGEAAPDILVVPNIERLSPLLADIKVAASPRWAEGVRRGERERIEAVTFAHAALKPLLEGQFDIIHCLERDVCEVIYQYRHLFARTPQVVFSNGGAIPGFDLPACDFVQEYTDYNLARSARRKAFVIPHGVDCERFHPGVQSDVRRRFGIPDDVQLAISVGTICYNHKRMDHVIRELAPVDGLHLLVVGQENEDSAAIKQLGKTLMGDRVVFTTMTHEALPEAYAAADFFVLGSLFETFGIVYIEALAMGLPVVCSDHPNQRGIVKEGVFVDMAKPGALTAAVRGLDPQQQAHLRQVGPQIARRHYALDTLRERYLAQYRTIAAAPTSLPQWNLRRRIASHLGNAVKQARRLLRR